MKTRILLSLLILSSVGTFAQKMKPMPLVFRVENSGADTKKPKLLPFDQLPVVESLPDPFRWADSQRQITKKKDWEKRRAEIAEEIQNYEIGFKPSRPDTLTAIFKEGTLTVTITENGNTLVLSSKVNLPEGNGPFPAIIGIGWPTGSLPADIFTSRGIATITFNFSQVMAHTQKRGTEPFNKLYPGSRSIGTYAAWSWGVSRLIDGLELVPEAKIDLTRLAISGCSFAGKMALFAGAFDERIALTIAQEPGGGGHTAWRVTEKLDGKRETLRNAQGSFWYREDFNQFNEAVIKLPYDHHELMAMVAPRALLVLGNTDYEWLADESGYVGCKAASEVWKALGVPDRFGFSIVGGHMHCKLPDIQKPEVVAFVEKFLLGNQSANTNVARSPFNTDLSRWITWKTPKLK